MNVIFSVKINEDGLLELQTGYINEKTYAKLHEMIYNTKRVVISIRKGSKDNASEFALCTTIDDSYAPTGYSITPEEARI